MANLKVPNLCGASPEFNSIQTEFEKLITSGLDGLESDASTLSSTMGTDITSLETELRALVPALPALPNVNLQSLITSLSTLTPGTFAYTQLLADITTDFGTELTAGGYTLDTLVTKALAGIQGGGDLCSTVPNFELPAAGGTAKEKSVESKQATIDSAEEKKSTVVKNLPWLEEQKENETRVASMQVEGESEDADVVKGTITATTPPTESTGAYKVKDESSKVTYDGNEIEVTTPAEQNRKNISTTGLAKRKSKLTEYFKLTSAALDQQQTNKMWLATLKHIPIPASVKVSANFVEDGGGWFEKDDGSFAAIEGTVQEFARVPPNPTLLEREGKAKSLRSRGTDSWFYVGDNKTNPPDLVLIAAQGEVWKAHTKTNNHPVYFIPEREGVIFVITYSYFENYDPGLVEVK